MNLNGISKGQDSLILEGYSCYR
jgi:tetratricopeptide (TPR) repeat protein